MHSTYYFLRFLSSELNHKLLDFELVECFTQNKNELILSFLKDEEAIHILINLNTNFNAIAVKSNFHKAKSSFQNVFKALNGKKCKRVIQIPFDRSFFIEFDDESKLLFKLHGNRSNILWLDDMDKVLGVFISKHSTDWNIELEDMQKAAPSLDFTPSSTQEILDANPFLGKTAKSYLIQQFESIHTIEEQAKFYTDFIDQIVEQPVFALQKNKLTICLWKETDCQTFDNAIDASNHLFSELNYYHFFTLRKEQKLSELSKSILQTEKYIQKVKSEFEKLKNQESLKESADVIMANLHLIKEPNTIYTLDNFYTQSTLEFSYKQDEKPQLIAQKWYKKSKNQHLQFAKFNENIHAKGENLALLVAQKERIEQVKTVRELNLFLKTEEKTETIKTEKPFKQAMFEGFEILIGRNSKNNDELIKYGHKNDIWLHAKDVSGSHVLIRSANKKINKAVIEYAAGLAAYYSKRKTDSLCPVIFTELKYVKKRKGFLPGQVVVEREEIVFTAPYSIQQSALE